ncbi:MAG: DUF6952 family protein [Flexibacteraceae bacterium]|jgi:hypothetical protein
MKMPAIKKLVDTYNTTELKAAEEALYAEETLAIEVEGDDEGEQLTHVLAAIYIQEKMSTEGADYKSALRAYTTRVRECLN